MFNYFQSPTFGKMSFEEVIENLVDFIIGNPKDIYKLIVGTDSEGKEEPDFVTAIVIHRQGKGGRYFWKKIRNNKKYTLRTRIYEETMFSLSLAIKLREKLEKKLQIINNNSREKLVRSSKATNYKDLEIHTDIGQTGETRNMIKEIVGMVRGNGFEVKIKPESFGASSIADHCLK